MSAPDEVPVAPPDPRALPEWVRWYGGPRDPYVRVEDDRFHYEGGEPRMRRRVTMRAVLDEIPITFRLGGEP